MNIPDKEVTAALKAYNAYNKRSSARLTSFNLTAWIRVVRVLNGHQPAKRRAWTAAQRANFTKTVKARKTKEA